MRHLWLGKINSSLSPGRLIPYRRSLTFFYSFESLRKAFKYSFDERSAFHNDPGAHQESKRPPKCSACEFQISLADDRHLFLDSPFSVLCNPFVLIRKLSSQVISRSVLPPRQPSSMIALTPPFTRLAASRLSCPTSASASKRSLSTYRDIKVLPFTQKQLYRVIADIDSYSAFIPFLTSSKVLNAPPDGSKPWLEEPEDEKVELQSELAVGFAGFQEKYVSKNVCTKFHSVTVSDTVISLSCHCMNQAKWID